MTHPQYPAEAVERLRERIATTLEITDDNYVDCIKIADLAALLSYVEGMKWRTIESAPKDGTHILVFPALLGVPLVATWERPGKTPPMMRLIGHETGHDGFWRAALTGKPTPYAPTHWLPLPPAPDREG